MNAIEAIDIVLKLARGNSLGNFSDAFPEQKAESQRQQAAISLVEGLKGMKIVLDEPKTVGEDQFLVELTYSTGASSPQEAVEFAAALVSEWNGGVSVTVHKDGEEQPALEGDLSDYKPAAPSV